MQLAVMEVSNRERVIWQVWCCRILLGSMLLLGLRKKSREPKKALKEKELESRLPSLSPAYALPRELEQSRFWFCRTEVRLRLFL